MNRIKTGVCYYRVSTQSQVEKGQGLDVQRQLCRAYCKQHRVKIEAEYADEGVSGATVDRPGLQDMLAGLNGVDLVVVANTSRLWRDDLSRVLIQRELRKAEKDVAAVDNASYSLYSETPEDYLVHGMLELLDSYERLTITLKLKRARRQKASKGQKACGVAPYGYRWTERKANGRREKVVEQDSSEAETVRDIYRSYLRLESVAMVRAHLERDGITNRRGNPFTRQALRHILKNDFYKGVVHHGPVQEKGQHEPVVSKILFGKVQKVLVTRPTADPVPA